MSVDRAVPPQVAATAERGGPLKTRLRPYLYLLPAMGLFAVFVFGPAILNLILTMFRWSPLQPEFVFIGSDNVTNIVMSREFRRAASNTLAYGLVTVPVSLGLGLMFALLIDARMRGRAFWRAVYFLPVAAMLVAMAVVWQFILDERVGLLNTLLASAGLPRRGWLVSSSTAMPTVIAFGLWRLAGYMMVLYMAGLAAIPPSVYEAASLDGLRGVSRFRHITWPLLGSTTIFAAVIGTILAIELFDPVKIMTDGGPAEATTTLALLIWREGFAYFSFGRAAVVSIVIFVASLVATLVQLLLFNRKVYYAS